MRQPAGERVREPEAGDAAFPPRGRIRRKPASAGGAPGGAALLRHWRAGTPRKRSRRAYVTGPPGEPRKLPGASRRSIPASAAERKREGGESGALKNSTPRGRAERWLFRIPFLSPPPECLTESEDHHMSQKTANTSRIAGTRTPRGNLMLGHATTLRARWASRSGRGRAASKFENREERLMSRSSWGGCLAVATAVLAGVNAAHAASSFDGVWNVSVVGQYGR